MSRSLTLAGYAVIAVLLAANQVVALAFRRFSTVGEAIALLTRRRTGRYLVLAAWLWVGWHLFVRTSAG